MRLRDFRGGDNLPISVMMTRLRTLVSIELLSTEGEPLDTVMAQRKRLALLAYMKSARFGVGI